MVETVRLVLVAMFVTTLVLIVLFGLIGVKLGLEILGYNMHLPGYVYNLTLFFVFVFVFTATLYAYVLASYRERRC